MNVRAATAYRSFIIFLRCVGSTDTRCVWLACAVLASVCAQVFAADSIHPATESRATFGNVRDEIDAARARIAAQVAQYHDPVGPRTWIDGARLWYVESSRDGARRWWLCDATKTGAEARVPLFDHAAVAALVAAVGDVAPDRPHDQLHDQIPVRGVSVSNDRVAIALEGREQPVVCALGGAIVAVNDPTARALLETSLKPGKRRSRGQGASVHLTFENRLDEAVEIFWIDRANAERSYGRIEAGDSRRQQTFGGHAWFVRTVLGRELGHAMANDLDRVIVIGDAPPAEPEPIDTQDGQRETQSEAELRVPRAEKAESDAPTNVIPPYEVRAERGSLQFVDGAGRTFFQAEGPDASRREANGFTGGFWVSPTRDAVFAMRVDRPEQRRVTIIESTPKDQLQPRVRSFDYVKPGDPIDTSIPHLFRVELDASSALVAREVPLDRTLFATPWSIDRVRMLPNGREVAFLYNQRGHQVVRLFAIDLATGAARRIAEESSATFVDWTNKVWMHWLDETGELLWMTEKSGWNHIELIDVATGSVKRRVTEGAWNVRRVAHVDEAARTIDIALMGRDPTQDPYHIHHARVLMDTGALVMQTAGNGTCRVEFSPSREALI